MNKKLNVVLLICSSIAICLSIATMILCIVKTKPADVDTQYVLYLGTNDKDTNQPVFSKDESKAKLIEILVKHFGGYTIQEANGGWLDEDKLYQEYTLVIYLSDTTIDKIHTACDEMIQVFNQSSVLIQANQTTTEFYAGQK